MNFFFFFDLENVFFFFSGFSNFRSGKVVEIGLTLRGSRCVLYRRRVALAV